MRQIQRCYQNPLWTSSLESGRSSMDQEGFLKDDQIYFCQYLSYREVWYINFYVLCETNPMVSSKSLMDIILGIRKILHGLGRVPEKWPDKFFYFWATDKCDILILMYIARQIHWWGQNYLLKSSLVSGRSWFSLLFLIESTLWLTDRELVSIRIMG